MLWKAGKSLSQKVCFLFFFSEQLGRFPEHYLCTSFYLINMQKYQPLQIPNKLCFEEKS